MSKQDELHADLSYVREAVERSEAVSCVRTIYLLWAVVILVGFPLADFAPRAVQWYWTFAGPLGFLASLWLGYRDGVKRGQRSRSRGLRHVAHWVGMMACIFLTVPLGATGVIAWEDLNRIILLILAFGYFLGGVHLDRPLAWAGVLMAIGYVTLFLVHSYVWTLLGVFIGASLLLSALFAGKEDVAP